MTARAVIALVCLLLFTLSPASAQMKMGPRLSPGGIEVLGPPPGPAVAATDVLAPGGGNGNSKGITSPADTLTGTDSSTIADDSRYSINLGLFQPMTARVGVRILERPRGSLWLEVYGGSVLLDAMYGFGARMQYTARQLGNGDRLMVAPGFGLQIIPTWDVATSSRYDISFNPWNNNPTVYKQNSLYYLVADVDISWLHLIRPQLAFEVGVKLGLAWRTGGDVGNSYPGFLMFGPNLYPVVSVYSGFRF